MAVSISTLKEEIKAAFDAEKEQTDNQQASINRIAEAIADAVAKQIVQGINTATVTPVLASSTGSVTGTITIEASAS
jgi:ferritin-like metal-binding protein YciE